MTKGTFCNVQAWTGEQVAKTYRGQQGNYSWSRRNINKELTEGPVWWSPTLKGKRAEMKSLKSWQKPLQAALCQVGQVEPLRHSRLNQGEGPW